MPTEATTALFVYGTLMRGRPAHGLLAPHVVAGHVARARGQLFLMPPGYPALVDAPAEGWVYGELLELASAPWPRLDEYEGFDPGDLAGSLYRRGQRPVEVGDRTRLAWCYWMPSDHAAKIVAEGARPLPEGRWPPR